MTKKQTDKIMVMCDVCEKEFEKPYQILIGEGEFAVAECEYCSDECRNISKESEKNKTNTCGGCNTIVNDYDGANGYNLDFDKRQMDPICDKCTAEFVAEIKKEFNKD
jgi:hypothetical protein